ncbi:cytochrome c biogenesis protein CcsA [Azospirillum sp. SYSU D00513]|uniref:cytochrome C assembly family protein n=1 Tax=Azospirillum sp. SYSU D00513 TaxID=2812561 RepID=UPI001A959A15|nr:cytochrome c biogenesis protein CcsA [Azospirillum sp. SYSU D00513]
MSHNLIYSLTALLTLLPASLYPFRRIVGHAAPDSGEGRSAAFWIGLLLAAVGSVAFALTQIGGQWHTGLSTALWVTIAACMLLYTALCLGTRSAWRLSPLLLPYLFLVGALATISQGAPSPSLRGGVPGVWIDLHIAVSVVTYALLTIAAVASLAAFLQQRALKSKRPTPLSRFLPPVAESERLQVRLLAACELVLGAGLATGMAVLHYEQGVALRLDHKILLSLATFAVVGGLLLAQMRSGVRGRTAARMVLIAYLLLTLAYPGVKFVTDVLLG